MRYGLVSVAAHPRECKLARATVNGLDVTRDCFAANDVEGWVDCFARNENGAHYVENGSVKRERIYGQVVIDFPGGLD